MASDEILARGPAPGEALGQEGDYPEHALGMSIRSDAGLMRRALLFEVVAFLLLIVPGLALSFSAVKEGTVSFALEATATILRDIAVVVLVLYFIWRNGEPARTIGWAAADPRREVAIGLTLYLPLFFAASFLERVLQAAGLSVSMFPARHGLMHMAATMPDFVLGTLLVVVVAISEETVFRGYLIGRLGAVGGNPAFAVLVATFVFALGHGYEGTAGVITVGFMGMIFAVVYRWRGSLIAPMVMHFLQDFIAVVLLPLLAAGRVG